MPMRKMKQKNGIGKANSGQRNIHYYFKNCDSINSMPTDVNQNYADEGSQSNSECSSKSQNSASSVSQSSNSEQTASSSRNDIPENDLFPVNKIVMNLNLENELCALNESKGQSNGDMKKSSNENVKVPVLVELDVDKGNDEQVHDNKTPYYLENFHFILRAVFHDEDNIALFDVNDMQVIESFHNLSGTVEILYFYILTYVLLHVFFLIIFYFTCDHSSSPKTVRTFISS